MEVKNEVKNDRKKIYVCGLGHVELVEQFFAFRQHCSKKQWVKILFLDYSTIFFDNIPI